MASLYGINGDGAVYYDDGSGLIWIPDSASFTELGFNWADIDWVDVLPYPAQDPYQASDNPAGADVPPPGEGSPAPAQPAPPSSPPSSSGPVPVVAVVGPANIVAGYSITPQGQVVANEFAPPGSIPGPITLAAGYTIYDVNGQATVAPVGFPPGTFPPDPSTLPLDPTVYGIRQPGGSGTTISPTFNGKITAQGQHNLLLAAMQGSGQDGVLTAQVIAKTMGNAVV